MPLRQLLSTAYAALAQATDDVGKLDRELEAEPRQVGDVRGAGGGLASLMLYARMPQEGSRR